MAIQGNFDINKATYPLAYIKILSFIQSPNTEPSDLKYKITYFYNLFADSIKDVVLSSGSHIITTDDVESSFTKCYADLKQYFPGFVDV